MRRHYIATFHFYDGRDPIRLRLLATDKRDAVRLATGHGNDFYGTDWDVTIVANWARNPTGE